MKVLVIVLIVLAVLALITFLIVHLIMPVRTPKVGLPAASDAQRRIAAELRRDVETLAREPRNVPLADNLDAAASYIERSLSEAGYGVERQRFEVEGVDCYNLAAELPGASPELVIVGAHYDSVDDAPGADDNASGVAVVLALARRFRGTHPAKTIRFVFFANEEPPYFQTRNMGSYVYALSLHDANERVAAMLSVESVGYFDPRPNAQHYPAGLSALFPDTGDFIAFAANQGSRDLLTRCVKAFRGGVQFPVEGAALPELIPEIGWSDQWSFWQFGWKALMVTDTAPFRNPHYHMPTDTPETLDYDRMSRVEEGLAAVVRELGGLGAAF